jgi:hypothetical protein
LNLKALNLGDPMLVLRWVVEIPRIGKRDENFSLYLVVGAIREVDKQDR